MKETKADRTKAFILEKVAPIFNHKGYSETSLSDILNATGLTKGAVYGNFESKEDLALKALRYNLMQVINPLQEQINENKSAIKKLKSIAAYYRSYYAKMEVLNGCPLLNVVNDAKGVNEALFDAGHNAVNSIHSQIESIVQLGIDQGKIKKSTNTEETATLIYSIINGAVLMASLQKSDKALHIGMDAVDNLISKIKKSAKK